LKEPGSERLGQLFHLDAVGFAIRDICFQDHRFYGVRLQRGIPVRWFRGRFRFWFRFRGREQHIPGELFIRAVRIAIELRGGG
jgi:hypothetical protein